MLVPNVDAVGVRFDPITRKIGRFQFTNVCPVVVITKQGITPVGKNQSDFPPGVGGYGQLQAGGPPQARVAVLDAPPQLGGEGERTYPIGHVVFAIDVSSSMDGGSGSPDGSTKLKHIQKVIMTLAQSGIPDDTPLTLIVFDDESRTQIEYTTKIKNFFEAIQDLIPGSNTNITSAFVEAESKFKKHEVNPDDPQRKFFMLVTDGDHNTPSYDQNPIYLQAEKLGFLNCGGFIVGVGTGYNKNLIQECASRLGYAGWCHTPEDKSGINVFAKNIPAFLDQMRSMDYFVNVVAEGFTGNDFDRRFFSLTPAIIRAMYHKTGASHLGIDFLKNPHYVVRTGFQREGYSVGFATPEDLDKDNARLFLCLQNHSTSNLVFPKKQIPIYPLEDLPHHGMFEEAQEAKRIRDLILRAQLDIEYFLCLNEGDANAFDEFDKRNPDFVNPDESVVISQNLRNQHRGDEDEQFTRTSVSNAGSSLTSQTIADWRPSQAGTVSDVNAQRQKKPTDASYNGHSGPLHSNLDEADPPSQDTGNQSQDGQGFDPQHSGHFLGPLDLRPIDVDEHGNVPPFKGGNVTMYNEAGPIANGDPNAPVNGAPPAGGKKGVYHKLDNSWGIEVLGGERDLQFNDKLKFNSASISIGRGLDNHIIIDIGAVSRNHCILGREGDDYYINDLNSRNGTYVNGKRINGRVKLNNGDQVKMCDLFFLVHIKQK